MGELILPVPIMMVDDRHVFNDHLKMILINLGYPKGLIMSTENLAEAESWLQQHLPNLIFIDVEIAPIAKLNFIKKLKHIHPDSYVIAILAQQQTGLLFDAIQSGAQGYVFHHHTDIEIINNIKSILRGGAPIHHDLAQYILSRQVETIENKIALAFTTIEYEILNLISTGLNSQQVADQTDIPLYKIEGNIKNTYKKIASLQH
ncbi:response regulator [Acinetobacter sp. UBA3106]|uniref:response regulator n=3 Tax=Acinetobacter TaxID=469 RepID=UPI001215E144|nr:response regulator [Acinetobacter sp. UBA3106]RZJ23912.1 MAG: response regulator transcription factor [Acinetobacter sp.]